jgi:hypothetical protein
MNRSTGVTATAVLAIVGSAFCILFSLLVIAAAFLIPSDPPQPPFFKFALPFTAALFIGGSALGIATAIGLLRLRRWARISLLVFSGLLVFFAGISVPLIFAVPIHVQDNLPAEAIRTTRIVFSVFYLLLVAVGCWWLYLFNTRAVKEQFLGGGTSGPAPQGPQKPLSIVIIAWIMLIGGCLLLPFSLLKMPTVILGFILTGWIARLVYLAYGVAQVLLGLGLLKLKPLSRTLAVYFLFFGLLNTAAQMLLPGREARFAALMKLNPLGLPATNVPPPASAYWFGLVFGTLSSLVLVWFLIRGKDAFLAAGQTQSAP